ncbi:peptidoglycan editing factor PgeF [Pseudanabaena sp. FACHB-1998]|uniref:peptidoglycan editing factor PgeF n=1 Tax=Pseudanabaena sp. FACHB-1998 TaxID=2692858 RepID=UPI0016815431|nr:peptidoglycan editing factor PgeF [Pseudanabaena sp. FACHB-1998]MBD2176103.1 peptidoglycan editing factor PgeF [Pseudanabaena sp. FACHB-1998]
MTSNQWEWQNGVLTCELLADWKHGFFTRSHAPKLPKDLHFNLAESGKAYRAKQVHGNRLIHRNEINDALDTLPEADGVWATRDDQHNHSVWVCTADCVPVLIGDLKSGSVAAIHAGWRGTAAGIVTKAITTLCEQGSELIDLRVALGPAISGKVYQVTQDVANQVTATVKQPVGLHPDDHPERVKLDLRQVQLQQLQELGIPLENVAIAPYCTLQNEEIFFSYRRYFLNNPNPLPRAPQVQWSGIAIA